MPEPVRVVPVACPFGHGATVYVYYIDAPEPALVDTGVASSPGSVIEPALRAHGLSLRSIRWILATHGHWDHIGGAHAARGMADTAQVLLHGNDRDWLLSRRAHMHPDGYQSIPFRYLDDPEALARQDALVMENLSGELAADRELVGGEHIHLGGDIRLEAVHTPGHSPGSVSFVLDGLDWVFTGDGVQGNGSQSGQFPLFIDPVAYRASQQRLLDDVRPKRLYMGHRFRDAAGNLHDAQLERPAVADMLRDSLAVQERIAEAVKLVTPAAVEQPNALALGPAAEALGYAPDQPLTWPNALFTTLHGYLPRAAAPTTTGM